MKAIKKAIWIVIKIYAFLDLLTWAVAGVGIFAKRCDFGNINKADDHDEHILKGMFEEAYCGWKSFCKLTKRVFFD